MTKHHTSVIVKSASRQEEEGQVVTESNLDEYLVKKWASTEGYPAWIRSYVRAGLLREEADVNDVQRSLRSVGIEVDADTAASIKADVDVGIEHFDVVVRRHVDPKVWDLR